jgi:hypothetical protein
MDRDRRNQLILVAVATLALVGLIYSLGVSRLQFQMAQDRARLAESQKELDRLRTDSLARSTSEQTRKELEQLSYWEAVMPQSDVYRSLLSRVEPLAQSHGIREFILDGVQSRGDAISDAMAQCRYLGMAGSLSGVGDYLQLGSFLADFENDFPFFYLSELTINRAGSGFITSDADNPVLGMHVRFQGCAYTNAVFD